MAGPLHILKLCVGAEQVEDLTLWQDTHRHDWAGGRPVHVTRMWPKRAAEVLDGGSLYWVFKGAILCRQRILALEERVGGDGIARCALMLDPEIVRTHSAARRPFQGWRYLSPDEAPPDLPRGRTHEDALPPALAQALAEIGLR